jgi:peptide-methionine (R)-S-oxide reductase
MRDNLPKTEAEWRALLDEDTYYVTREKGTERPFTGKYNSNKEQGIYRCACCGQELFSSDTKYDSGSGWPSFFKPADSSAIAEETDSTHGMVRTEILCSNCGAHLGHVFPDGPKPTGLRYCVNSLSLDFQKNEGKE